MNIEVWCQRNLLYASIDLDFVQRDQQGNACYAAEALTMAKIEPRKSKGPALRLGFSAAQGLMDQLWTCGVRPTDGAGSAGAMKQAEHHIDSLRKIAFALLPK